MNTSISDQVMRVPSQKRCVRAFTLLELLVVFAIIAILASILIPAFARSRARGQTVFCLNNTKQLVAAWIMHSDDHSGRLIANLGEQAAMLNADGTSPMDHNWVNNVLDWGLSTDNTNIVKMTDSGLGAYLRSGVVFRCPADTALSDEQITAGWNARVRSYSMNAMLGDAGELTASGANVNNPDYVQFFSYSDIRLHSTIFVFLDEHPDTIDDGYFVNRARDRRWWELPGSYHSGGANFAFADGHGETHRWKSSITMPPSQPFRVTTPVKIPGRQAVDFNWVINRMSIPQPSQEPDPSDLHVY